MAKHPNKTSLFLCVFLLVSLLTVLFIQLPQVKADNTNLAPLGSDWQIGSLVGRWTNNVLDNTVTYNGQPTLRSDPITGNDDGNGNSNYARECDGPWLTITAGSHLVFSVWMKTTGSSFGYNNTAYMGARFGVDFYGANGRIGGKQSPGACTWDSQGTDTGAQDSNFVHWGTTTWTQKTMDFIVPQLITSDGGGPYPAGLQVAPTAIIPWLQVLLPTDDGQAWYAAPTLQINPSSPIPSPTPTPTVPGTTPTPTPTPTPYPTYNPNVTPPPPPLTTTNFLITQAPFILNFTTGQSFQVQSLNPPSTITFTVTSGTLNGTGTVGASSSGGTFNIIPTTSGTLLVTTSGAPASVYIGGTYANNIPYSFSPGG